MIEDLCGQTLSRDGGVSLDIGIGKGWVRGGRKLGQDYKAQLHGQLSPLEEDSTHSLERGI